MYSGPTDYDDEISDEQLRQIQVTADTLDDEEEWELVYGPAW